MNCPICHKDNPLDAKYCDCCHYEFTDEDRKHSYDRTVFGRIDKLIDSVKKISDTANLSIVFNNRIFRIALLVLLIAGGIYINTHKEQYAVVPSEEYRVEYNQSLNEYYLYTDNDYINIKLYLTNDIKTVTVNICNEDDTVISYTSYGINDRIILNKDVNVHYEIIEDDISFKVYITNE